MLSVIQNCKTFWLFMTCLDPNRSSVYREYFQDTKEFREFYNKIIQDRRASNIEGNDLLGLLLKTQNSAQP